MKKRVFFSKPMHLLILFFAFGMMMSSCSKEEVIAPNEEVNLNSFKGDFDFFNTLGSDFEDLFDEEVWQLLNSDPSQAMLELTGVQVQAPIGEEVVWIPYIAYTDAQYSLTPIFDGSEMIGIQANADGSGNINIDAFGYFQVGEGTTQNNFFDGTVNGSSSFAGEQVAIDYDVVAGLPSKKGKSGMLDGVLLQKGQSGKVEESLGGFAVRKAETPLPEGPSEPGESVDGQTNIITLGYLAFSN